MRAIVIDRYGGPKVVRQGEIAVPRPGAGDVLVRVACAGINFMDIATRRGLYEHSLTYRTALPCTLGMEGAGTVVEVGDGIGRLSVGDRVAWCLAWGSYAEYARVPEALAVKVPDAIGDDLAAAAIFQGCTAHYLVHDTARLKPGDTCLVHAASGSIGQIIVQLARNAGATVLATASTEAKRAVATARGAAAVFDYDNGRFAEAVRAATGGAGVDVVFDAVGRQTLRDSFRATRKRGLVVNYGAVSGAVTDLDPLELGEAGSLFLTRPRLADHMADAATVQRRAADIFGAIEAGSLGIEIAARYPFDRVNEALARLEAREQIGKPVLVI